ncbi:MAG: sterol desaturase family protein [Bacteroidota bacterium]|nr:sterol desaturase family protein [Candidatus Kapabacteria bacterium]MDW8219825.1 sterol desaturase family protein [Bacteroidota bacterium]
MIWNIALVLIAFVGMEIFSALFHKYVMHGALWCIHKTHHQKQHGQGMFELNDLFSLTFAVGAILLLILGLPAMDWRLWVAIGVIAYGTLYFIIHDIIIHRRIQWLDSVKNSYIQALRRAHKAHHAYTTQQPGEEYGLLWVSRKYWK